MSWPAISNAKVQKLEYDKVTIINSIFFLLRLLERD